MAKNKEYIELATLKTGSYFTTRKLKNLAVEYQETTAQYKAKQSKLVSEIVSIASKYHVFLHIKKLSRLRDRHIRPCTRGMERCHCPLGCDCQVKHALRSLINLLAEEAPLIASLMSL